ncbi:MAG: hypothetical protein V1820_02920 [archaeon]
MVDTGEPEGEKGGEGMLEKLPYLLRKQTLQEEMPEFSEERDIFRRAQAGAVGSTLHTDRILVLVANCREGTKALNAAIDIARQNGSELVVAFYTEIIPALKDRVISSGIRYKLIAKPTSATGDIMFVIKKEKVDLAIIPEKFSDKLSGISQVTKQIVEASESSVLVVR